MDQGDFNRLLSTSADVAGLFPEGLVFIGGIAVYLHAINHEKSAHLAEFTHDADFYISLADAGDLRDIEELVPNRRLSKCQFMKGGFAFDVYIERQSSLIVPYDHAAANSVAYDGLRVAGLEELMALKLEAYRDRRGSAKGLKDAKDLVRIAVVSELIERDFDAALCATYLSEEHLDLLHDVARGPAALEMAMGNAVVAKRLRATFNQLADRIVAASQAAQDTEQDTKGAGATTRERQR